VVADDVITVLEADEEGRVRRPRRSPLAGSRLIAAAVLAVVEIVAFLIWRPDTILVSALAVAVLILAVAILPRTRPGLVRDVLIVVASAQALVVFVPLLLAASLALAVVVALVVIVGFVVVGIALMSSRRS